MNKFPLLNFIFLQIYVNKTKHLSIFIIATFLIFILSSFLFISNSISKNLKLSLDNQADFIVQRIKAGKVVDTPNQWVDQILEINGISNINERVYGQHYYEPKEHYFTIVGVDFYDTQVLKELKELIKDIDIEKFLAKKNMIIGSGVKEFLDEFEYFDYYTFRPPDRSKEKVYIYDKFPSKTNILSSDMIIMDINLAKTILGIDEDYSTDIIFNVPNIDERVTIENKLRVMHFDTRIIQKDDIYKGYINFFNYKTTIFMILYMIALITFILIIYQRYSYINSIDKKEIGILRSLGWSINNIIKLKIIENLIIFILAYILGVNLGYIYVFILDAPFLSDLFLGFNNLSSYTTFSPYVDFGILSMMFFFFIVPIIAAILVPVWKISIIEPTEAMR